MNKIDLPTFDDQAALQALSINRRLGSFPLLQDHVVPVSAAYEAYLAAQGNASTIVGAPLHEDLVAPLLAHYENPPKCLPHIEEMRQNGRSKPCPMCGSSLGGTLDHVLPKAGFPCFAIFAPNLVPACDCNSHRINDVVGPHGARILHPYFDTILSERLLAATFENLGEVPTVSIRFLLDPAHALYSAVVFHFDNVVAKTAILDWIRGEWTKLILEPGSQVADLRRSNSATADELLASIEEERAIRDRSLRGKNNWHSVFYSGLLDNDVIDWILNALRAPGREVNGPLVPGVR